MTPARTAVEEILKEAALTPGYSEFHWHEAGITDERLEAIIQSAIDTALRSLLDSPHGK